MTIADVQAGVPNALQALLMDEQQRQAYEDALVNRIRPDIERTAGVEARRVNENAFGRGLGLSTINAQVQAENQRVRDEALAKARIDAQTAARSAQLSGA